MKEQRKKIIVNEIIYWKANKILPDHYCDYLLALYSQGEEIQEAQMKQKGSGAVLEQKNAFFLCLEVSLIFAALITVVALHFTELSIILQTAILTIIVAGLMLLGLKTSNQQLIQPLAYITAAFILLVLSVELWGTFGGGSLSILYSLIGSHCFMWILFGSFRKQLYFLVAGLLGLGVLVGSILI